MKQHQIKLSIPHLGGNESRYALDAIESTWITPLGPYVDRFEQLLEEYTGVDNIVALSSGTAALHLALADLGVGEGDYVICQSMTFSASANPIIYMGATPVFVDSEPMTWNISPRLLDLAIKTLDRKPKAIIAVDLYGMPADYDAIEEIASRYGIPVIEDAAEAIGSEFKRRKCGTICRYGVFSFNGNKMITTSGGGALICPTPESASHVKYLSTQAREPLPYYYHTETGYNYRLSNVSAAIGCAQLEVLQQHIDRRREICRIYADGFNNIKGIRVHTNPTSNYNSNYWLSTILIDDKSLTTPEQLRQSLANAGIETRRLWRPMHIQPVFANAKAFIDGTSERLFDSGLCLPSSSTMPDDDVHTVINAITRIIGNSGI